MIEEFIPKPLKMMIPLQYIKMQKNLDPNKTQLIEYKYGLSPKNPLKNSNGNQITINDIRRTSYGIKLKNVHEI